MISEEVKTTIDALSKEELRLEVNKGNQSRFQREKFAYVQSRLQQLELAAQADQHGAELAATTAANEIAERANAIATEANSISKEANVRAKDAWRISVLSAVIALVAMIVSMCARQ